MKFLLLLVVLALAGAGVHGASRTMMDAHRQSEGRAAAVRGGETGEFYAPGAVPQFLESAARARQGRIPHPLDYHVSRKGKMYRASPASLPRQPSLGASFPEAHDSLPRFREIPGAHADELSSHARVASGRPSSMPPGFIAEQERVRSHRAAAQAAHREQLARHGGKMREQTLVGKHGVVAASPVVDPYANDRFVQLMRPSAPVGDAPMLDPAMNGASASFGLSPSFAREAAAQQPYFNTFRRDAVPNFVPDMALQREVQAAQQPHAGFGSALSGGMGGGGLNAGFGGAMGGVGGVGGGDEMRFRETSRQQAHARAGTHRAHHKHTRPSLNDAYAHDAQATYAMRAQMAGFNRQQQQAGAAGGFYSPQQAGAGAMGGAMNAVPGTAPAYGRNFQFREVNSGAARAQQAPQPAADNRAPIPPPPRMPDLPRPPVGIF